MMGVPVFGSRMAGYPYIERPSAYAIVRNESGCFALMRTPRGFYLPGGGIEASETPEQAIKREAMEEADRGVTSAGREGYRDRVLAGRERLLCEEVCIH